MNTDAKRLRRALLFWGCVIAGLVFASQFIGCAQPDVPSYLPTIAVAAAVEGGSVPDPSPQPSPPGPLPPASECKECDGRGWLGDGQPRADCLSCTSEWDDRFGGQEPQQVPQPAGKAIPSGQFNVEDDIQRLIGIIADLDARLAKLERRLEDLEVSPSRPAADNTVVPQREGGGASDIPSEAKGAKRDAPEASAIEWVSMSEAVESPKPVLVYLRSTNCRYCDLMERDTFSDPRVIDETGFWACVKIVNPTPQQMRRFGTSSFPTTVVFRKPGQPGQVVAGYQSADSFLSLIRRFPQ